ncbi:MAG: HEAT repeat domain-containing protein [Chitinophagaceae bacterium]|nr:HEAT repeat domain-containing protein [Chitinophagaceae bacterium]
MNRIIDKIKTIEHGFKHIIIAGDTILADSSTDHITLAAGYLKDESFQVRMLATYMLGQLSVSHPRALKLLETKVASDSNWRVQEMLAKAFDHYCQSKGYEASLPQINKWLSGKDTAICRAVVEGLRIWTGRPFFRENPQIAIELIAALKIRAGESVYLLKSIGNALHDIRKKFPDLVDREIAQWDLTEAAVLSIVKLVKR